MEMTVDRGRIKALRKQKLWTQEQLAEESGVHARTIQRIERDGTTSMQSCVAIAKALGTDAAELILPVPDGSLETRSDRWLSALRTRLGIRHNQAVPTSLKVVLLLWFVIGAADIVRALENFYIYLGLTDGIYGFSFFWLIPGLFNLFVFYQLLANRPAWRRVAIAYNWVFMAGALFAAIVLCNALFEPAFNPSEARALLEDSQFSPASKLVLYLIVAALVFFTCFWQNYVLSRPDVRKLFSQNAAHSFS